MRVAIHTHYTNSWEELAALVIPNLQRYADKHGYDLHVEKYQDGNVDFVKTKTALKLLENYDLVFCLEADMLIMNHTKRVTDFIDSRHDFYICKDINGVNGGSFIIMGTEHGERFLKETNKKEGEFKTEQNVWETLEKYPNHDSMVLFLKHPSINSIPYKYYHNFGYINYQGQLEPTHEMGNFAIGDFILHLPGKPLEERIKIFNELKQHIVYE